MCHSGFPFREQANTPNYQSMGWILLTMHTKPWCVVIQQHFGGLRVLSKQLTPLVSHLPTMFFFLIGWKWHSTSFPQWHSPFLSDICGRYCQARKPIAQKHVTNPAIRIQQSVPGLTTQQNQFSHFHVHGYQFVASCLVMPCFDHNDEKHVRSRYFMVVGMAWGTALVLAQNPDDSENSFVTLCIYAVMKEFC